VFENQPSFIHTECCWSISTCNRFPV